MTPTLGTIIAGFAILAAQIWRGLKSLGTRFVDLEKHTGKRIEDLDRHIGRRIEDLDRHIGRRIDDTNQRIVEGETRIVKQIQDLGDRMSKQIQELGDRTTKQNQETKEQVEALTVLVIDVIRTVSRESARLDEVSKPVSRIVDGAIEMAVIGRRGTTGTRGVAEQSVPRDSNPGPSNEQARRSRSRAEQEDEDDEPTDSEDRPVRTAD